MALEPMTIAQMLRCLDHVRANFSDANVISNRHGKLIVRCRRPNTGDSIIVKMWSRPALDGRLRRLLRIAPSDHEWRNLVRMSRLGMAVPRPLGFARRVPGVAGDTDALFMEDLGECESAMACLKRLIREGREQEVLDFENVQIEMTAQMLEAGMLDTDHGMLNIVVRASGRPAILDVEVARWVAWPRLFPGMYGRMLGRIIGLHAFAVQPDVRRTTRFAARLRERLKPPPGVLRRARDSAGAMLQKQRDETGIDTRLSLPWD